MSHIRVEELSPTNGRLERMMKALTHSRSLREHEALYHLVKYVFRPGQLSGFGDGSLKSYFIGGDTIYCSELNTPLAVYLKIGFTNPWIRLRQGATYKRKFSKFALRVFADNAGVNNVEAILYVSHGTFVESSPIQEGLSGFALYSSSGSATTTATEIFASAMGGTATTLSYPTIGKAGGIMILKNIDAANTLYFGTNRTSIGGMFPLSPGETISVKLSGRICGIQLGTAPDRALYVRTVSGTCDYAFIVSPPEEDTLDFDNMRAGDIV